MYKLVLRIRHAFFLRKFYKKTYVNSMPYQILYEFTKQPC